MIFYDHIDEMTLFNDAMEASGMAWWLLEIPSGLIFYNPNKLKMLGFDMKDTEKFVHISKFAELLHPDDSDRVTSQLGACIDGKAKEYQASYRMKTKNGKYKVFFDRGKIVGRNKDGQIAIAGFAMDLTQTKLKPSAT